MPKRPKAKVHDATRLSEKTPNPAKVARIVKQLEQTNANKTRVRQGEATPHDVAVAARRAKRRAAGKTYDNWRKIYSARSAKPNVSNLEV